MKFPHRKSDFGIGILRGNLLILVSSMVIWQFSVNIAQPYLALYVISLGGTSEAIGIVNALGAIAGIFLYPLSGYIADMRGRVQLVSIATFAYACSFLVFAYAPSWQILAVASFLRSLVLFYSPILMVLQADSVAPEMRNTAFALAMSIPGAVGVFSPVIGGYLMDAMGIVRANQLIYSVGFVAGIGVALLRNWGLTETLKVTNPTVSISLKNLPILLKESYLDFIKTLRWLPKQIRVLAVMSMLQIFFANLSSAYYIVYAYTFFLFTPFQWGINSMFQGITNILMAYPAGRILDTHSRKKILIPCMLWTVLMPLLFITLINGNYFNLVIIAIIISVANAFLIPGFQSLLADYTPRERRGRVTSAIGAGNFFIDIRGGAGGWGGGTLLFIPSSVAQLLGGYLYYINPGSSFYLTAVGMAIVMVIAILFIRDPKTLED